MGTHIKTHQKDPDSCTRKARISGIFNQHKEKLRSYVCVYIIIFIEREKD
jgi:hypothetical protein